MLELARSKLRVVTEHKEAYRAALRTANVPVPDVGVSSTLSDSDCATLWGIEPVANETKAERDALAKEVEALKKEMEAMRAKGVGAVVPTSSAAVTPQPLAVASVASVQVKTRIQVSDPTFPSKLARHFENMLDIGC
jgi:hypothetical protein